MSGQTSINGFVFTSGSDVEITLRSGRTLIGKVIRTGSNAVLVDTPDGSRELGQDVITGIREITSDADYLLSDQRVTGMTTEQAHEQALAEKH